MKRAFTTVGILVSLALGCASRQPQASPGLEPHHSRMETNDKIVRKAVETDDTSTVWNWFKTPWARKNMSTGRF